MRLLFTAPIAAFLLAQPAIAKNFSSVCVLEDDEAVALIRTHDAEVNLDGQIRMFVYNHHGERIAKHSLKTDRTIDPYSEEKIFGAEVSKSAHHCEIDLKKVDVSVVDIELDRAPFTFNYVYHYGNRQPRYGHTTRVYKYKSTRPEPHHRVQRTRIYSPSASHTRKVTKIKVTL